MRHLLPLLLLLSTQLLFAQPGANDPAFNPNDIGLGNGDGANSDLYTTVLQPDGKILIGGSLTSYNGTATHYLARLQPDGTPDTSFHPGKGPNNYVVAMAVQPDGKILIGGYFTAYGGSASMYLARLLPDGSPDPSFRIGRGASSTVQAIVVQPDGKILIAGTFSTFNRKTRNRIARLHPDGSLDASFNAGAGANNAIRALALQADGRIVVGGSFTTFNKAKRKSLARLLPTGALDTSFDPAAGTNGPVHTLALQPDGRLLLGGNFTACHGTVRYHLARLLPTGALDTSFRPGAGSTVNAIALQPDGRALIGGSFTSYNGVKQNRLARLEATGALDTSFKVGRGANNSINTIVWQGEDKILIAGHFNTYNGKGSASSYLARLKADGALDTGFNPGTGANNTVLCLAAQSDGKTLVAGFFTAYNGKAGNYLVRLKANGKKDASFKVGRGANNSVHALALQADGRILVGGSFTTFNKAKRKSLARLLPTGALDTSFKVGRGADSTIRCIVLQADGKLLIAGDFTSYNGVKRNRIARLHPNGALDTSFHPGTGANGSIHALVLHRQTILIGGSFTAYDGTTRHRIARLNAHGALDTSFDPGTGGAGRLHALALQPDGRILVGGDFVSFQGSPRRFIARLHPGGALDSSFNPGRGASSAIHALVLQPDGRILIGGSFTAYNATAVNRIACLRPDGSLDAGFQPGAGANSTIHALVLRPGGGLLIGGSFTSYNGTGRNRVARVLGEETLQVKTPSAPADTM